MMLARCPACQTVFRVRPEQLRAHAGQVRCGHCREAFNALEHLIDEAHPPHSTGTQPAPLQTRPTAPPVTGGEPFFVLEDSPDRPQASRHDAALDFEIPDTLRRRTPRERAATPNETPALTNTDQLRFEPPPPPGRTEAVRSKIAPSPAATEQPSKNPEPADPAPPAADLPPAPLPDADRFGTAGAGEPDDHFPLDEGPATDAEELDRRYGPHPQDSGRRSLAGLLVGLLFGTLAAQAIYLFRGEIARDWPALRPALIAACAPFNCTVPLEQRAAEISVDASELQAEPGKAGRYTLHATVRNRAPYPQALPHLELTLLDGREQALARRVFTPQEWAPAAAPGGSFAGTSDLIVALPFETKNLDPAGYRVYVFYP